MSKTLILIFLAFFIGGCSIKDVSAPIKKYEVNNQINFKKVNTNGKILKISQFKTSDNLLGSNIWYKRQSSQTGAYLYSSWNQNFSGMVEQNLADTLYKSGLFKSVFVSYSKVKYDLVLEGNIIKAIQSVNRNSAKVIFEMRLYLINHKSSKLLGSRDFIYTKQCKSIDALGAVQAYQDIFKTFNKEVVLWLKKSIKEN